MHHTTTAHDDRAEPSTLRYAARRLGVTQAWLRAEVEAGRLPGLLAGGRVLIHVPTVRARLAERAAGASPEAGDEPAEGGGHHA